MIISTCVVGVAPFWIPSCWLSRIYPNIPFCGHCCCCHRHHRPTLHNHRHDHNHHHDPHYLPYHSHSQPIPFRTALKYKCLHPTACSDFDEAPVWSRRLAAWFASDRGAAEALVAALDSGDRKARTACTRLAEACAQVLPSGEAPGPSSATEDLVASLVDNESVRETWARAFRADRFLASVGLSWYGGHGDRVAQETTPGTRLYRKAFEIGPILRNYANRSQGTFVCR